MKKLLNSKDTLESLEFLVTQCSWNPWVPLIHPRFCILNKISVISKTLIEHFNIIKVLNTDRRWREWTCLLNCITYLNNYILLPNPTEDNIANPCIKNSRYWRKSKSKLMLKKFSISSTFQVFFSLLFIIMLKVN